MPLSCLDQNGERLQAFDLTTDQWSALKSRRSKHRHLRMPCCEADVVLKESRRGTRFFAHKNVGSCNSASECEEHRHLKMLAIEAARACGWHAEAEKSGQTPDGEQWRADVLATKGEAKVAIEVQWSGQVDGESIRRQQQYRAAGVRGLWLFRQPGFPISHDLPAACVGGSLEDGFTALLPHSRAHITRRDRSFPDRWRAAMPLRSLLEAAFSKRLRWGTPMEVFGDSAMVEVHAAEAGCDECGVLTDIIVAVEIVNPGMRLSFSLLELGAFRGATDEVLRKLAASFDRKPIKRRYSRTRGHFYVSNGCAGCDRLYGDHYLTAYRNDAKVVARFAIQLKGEWRKLAESGGEAEEFEPEWWVIPPA